MIAGPQDTINHVHTSPPPKRCPSHDASGAQQLAYCSLGIIERRRKVAWRDRETRICVRKRHAFFLSKIVQAALQRLYHLPRILSCVSAAMNYQVNARSSSSLVVVVRLHFQVTFTCFFLRGFSVIFFVLGIRRAAVCQAQYILE